MTDATCDATTRGEDNGSCELPAGWGTDHVGEGRCKLHGGNAGAPANNQNAATHSLNSDPHHYYQSLPPEEKEWVKQVGSAIVSRLRERTDEVDGMDRMLSRQIAIELHIKSRASAYVEKESGLSQDVPAGGSTRTDAAPLLEEVRKYSDAIFRDLKKLGVLDEADESITPEAWRDFLDGQNSQNR